MEFKTNVKYYEDVKIGTIFVLNDNELGLSIHQLIGSDGVLYLSCRALNLHNIYLGTKDFNTAVEKAKTIIHDKLNILFDNFNKIDKDEEINIVRW